MSIVRHNEVDWISLSNGAMNERVILIDHSDELPPDSTKPQVDQGDILIGEYLLVGAHDDSFKGVTTIHASDEDENITHSWKIVN